MRCRTSGMNGPRITSVPHDPLDQHPGLPTALLAKCKGMHWSNASSHLRATNEAFVAEEFSAQPPFPADTTQSLDGRKVRGLWTQVRRLCHRKELGRVVRYFDHALLELSPLKVLAAGGLHPSFEDIAMLALKYR
ncbi:hypothetical protein HPB50_005189 [Hyalomma asiaticum]|uniref:Uncharacterized protein n=1 Tax=Hyalomma asiaticum TaxID=266040 RepID=A0ACB7S6N4_HYAAI|nr:hypothetical protein HPB50_005189 [Hyalomma asiaticum]